MASKNEATLFERQIKMLRFVGISLEEKDGMLYNLYSTVVLTGILLLPTSITHATFVNLHNMDDLIENLEFAVAFGAAVLKVLIVLATRKKIIRAYQKLKNGVFLPNTKRRGQKERELIEDTMFYVNSETIILWIIALIYSFSASIEIIIRKMSHNNSGYWKLPFGDFSVFNVTYNPNFNIVWAYQTTYVFLGTVAFAGIDIFFVAAMAYLSSHCKILQILIKSSVARSHKRMMQGFDTREPDGFLIEHSEIEWKYLQQTLKEIVDYHMGLIKMTSEFEGLFRYQVLTNFVGFSLIICLAIFSITSMESFNFRALQQVTLAGGPITLQIATAYWGNEVIVQNLAIGEACAEVDYAGTDVRFQKGLSLMIQRTQIPVQFTVGKFSPLNLSTFLTVTKATYSYYMFLHNFE